MRRRPACPLCGGRAFGPAGDRRRAVCRRCGSYERHRFAWLVLEARPTLLGNARSLLHFAPEPCLERPLRERHGLTYRTADVEAGADLRLDLEALALPDAAFDAVLCSHVLEHVPDDARAMRELRRILAPGGWALVGVPVAPGRATTYEDPSITTPAGRRATFGQEDHVRVYGADVAGRLAAAGFRVEALRPAGAIGRHGLLPEEVLHLCSVA